MRLRLLSYLLLASCLLPAATKTTATAKGENRDLTLTVTLYIDPAEVNEIAGGDMGGHFIVADVKVEPKPGKEVNVDRDDFQLITDKDYEKTTPFAPSQIAGRVGLVVRQSEGGDTTTGPARGRGFPFPGKRTAPAAGAQRAEIPPAPRQPQARPNRTRKTRCRRR